MAAARPDRIFALFALLGGLVLAILLPPGLGGNETMNFRRVVAIAQGEMLLRPVLVPGGIVRFLDRVDQRFPDGSAPPSRPNGYGGWPAWPSCSPRQKALICCCRWPQSPSLQRALHRRVSAGAGWR